MDWAISSRVSLKWPSILDSSSAPTSSGRASTLDALVRTLLSVTGFSAEPVTSMVVGPVYPAVCQCRRHDSVIIRGYRHNLGDIIFLCRGTSLGCPHLLFILFDEALDHFGNGLIEVEVVIPSGGACHGCKRQCTPSACTGVLDLGPWVAQVNEDLLTKGFAGPAMYNFPTRALDEIDVLPQWTSRQDEDWKSIRFTIRF